MNKDLKGKCPVLVGKGITFDTGGISLKPGANMDERNTIWVVLQRYLDHGSVGTNRPQRQGRGNHLYG